ncbi:MAG: DUF4143 domain-containing protein [Deltaproteobacteria bacterium]|nr:DUF4143 domain-containing protein [Deltaproteobacteria bacterium]
MGANLWRELPPFSGNLIKRVSKRAKGMLFNTGLICYLLQTQRVPTLQTNPSLGAIFKATICLEIQAVIDSVQNGANLYHWRTPYGHEVDLVLEHEGRLYAFECKWGEDIKPSALVGLQAFRKTYGNKFAACIVVTPIGATRWIANGILKIALLPGVM